jgi:hypothetical protein
VASDPRDPLWSISGDVTTTLKVFDDRTATGPPVRKALTIAR